MKARSIGKKKGFITLEILIAFTVLILCMSAVITVIFGNQSLAVDLQTNIEAISKATTLLEKTRSDSRLDFNLVNPTTMTETSGALTFTKTLDVAQKDLFTKKVTSNVSWQLGERSLSTMLTTLLTTKDVNTCSSTLTGDWKNPQIESTINFSSITPSGTYTITDVDAYKEKLYVTAGKTSNISDPTFFVFDVHDPSNPALIAKVDNDILVKTGLNAIIITDTHAFVASASSYTRGQMQVIDTNSMSVVKTFKVPVLDSSGSSKGSGNSIFYKNKIIYLGLTKSTSENEFNIIDVADPVNPVHTGRYPIGNDINAVVARDGDAYIASPNPQELQILDISNLNNPVSVGGFNSTAGSGNGKSMYLIGNKLYLGKTTGAGFDFHILDKTNPATMLTELGGRDVASSVNGLIVRDYLSFLLTGTPSTGTKLQILKTDDPSHVTLWNTTLSLSGASNTIEPSIDCEGNHLYISSNDTAGQGSIYIIKPGP